MIGAGAAKTGLFWMRLGGEEEEEPSLAKTRNAGLLREEDWAGDTEERHALLIEAEDIVQAPLELVCFIVYTPQSPHHNR